MKWGRGGYLAKPRGRSKLFLAIGIVIVCFALLAWFSTSLILKDGGIKEIATKEETVAAKEPAIESKEEKPPACISISGYVFIDKNKNGNKDKTEKGMPSVTVRTVDGKVATTDLKGEYTFPCIAVSSGSNYTRILKLDSRTLPKGYKITSDNPIVFRTHSGGSTTKHFGVAKSSELNKRVIRLDFNSQAFVENSIVPSNNLEASFDTLISHLGQGPTVLRLTYQRGSEGEQLSKSRIENLAKIIAERANASDKTNKLEIEIRVVN